MKAITVAELGDPKVLEYKEVDKPSVGKNQVLIRTSATSVNYADIMKRRKNSGADPPFVPGLDVAGIIETVGSEVDIFKKGQRVIAFPSEGSYAEYTVADENLVFILPESLNIETAAASALVAFTSYHLLHEVGKIQPGDNVLIHAASGGIGTTAIQIAKILGAGKVIGTVGDDAKKETAKQAGADFVVNNKDHDFIEQIQEFTDDYGVDIILDSVAGKIGEQSMRTLALYGRFVNFGMASGQPVNFKSTDLHSSCRSALGFSIITTFKNRPEILQSTAKKVLNYLETGELKIIIGKRFSLNEAYIAHELIESRKSTGKVLLIP